MYNDNIYIVKWIFQSWEGLNEYDVKIGRCRPHDSHQLLPNEPEDTDRVKRDLVEFPIITRQRRYEKKEKLSLRMYINYIFLPDLNIYLHVLAVA